MGRSGCPACGRPVGSEDRHCTACGAALTGGGRRRVAGFAGWVVVGVLVAVDGLFAVSSLVPVVVLTIPVTIWLAGQLIRRGIVGNARWGVAVGASALPFFFAYTNRHGPGTYCQSIGSPPYVGQECADEWDPRPFLVAGVGMLLAAAVGTLWGIRRRVG
jgi:hypothetical protein